MAISLIWFVRHYDYLTQQAAENKETKQSFSDYKESDKRSNTIGFNLIKGNEDYEKATNEIKAPIGGAVFDAQFVQRVKTRINAGAASR